jgi:hypothetical protein
MKPNALHQSFFHPLDDIYVGSVAPIGETHVINYQLTPNPKQSRQQPIPDCVRGKSSLTRSRLPEVPPCHPIDRLFES